ncbi:MAG TPA: flagellar protein FliS [Terracidiphilus sp.]|jgi:flagellar protein FliS
MSSYRDYTLGGASAVDLVVALYDGIVRFLYAACDAVDRGDEVGRRAAVKRALDIIIHLQARLRMDIGGTPARVLSEFYATVFAEILQGSQSASRVKFEHAIECVRNVRNAWRQAALDPTLHPLPAQIERPAAAGDDPGYDGHRQTMRWNA